MKTPKLQPGEYFVRRIMYGGEGPLGGNGKRYKCQAPHEAAELFVEDMGTDEDNFSVNYVAVESVEGAQYWYQVRTHVRTSYEALPVEYVEGKGVQL